MAGEIVAVQNISTFADWIKKQSANLAKVAAANMDPERISKVVIMAAMRNPRLLQCTLPSISLAVAQAVEMGLEPGSGLQEAHLVPFQNGRTGKYECVLIVDYKGLIKLARQAGQISCPKSVIVHERDVFELDEGARTICHKPYLQADPGGIVGSYCSWKEQNGEMDWEWMRLDEIELIRNRSQSGRKMEGPWKTDYEEMAKKTVLKRAAKRWPKSVALARAIEVDNDGEFGEGFNEVAELAANMPEPEVKEEKPSTAAKIKEKIAERPVPEPAPEPAPAQEPAAQPVAETQEQLSMDIADEPRKEAAQLGAEPSSAATLEPEQAAVKELAEHLGVNEEEIPKPSKKADAWKWEVVDEQRFADYCSTFGYPADLKKIPAQLLENWKDKWNANPQDFRTRRGVQKAE
jgi:recombination protein RecT